MLKLFFILLAFAIYSFQFLILSVKNVCKGVSKFCLSVKIIEVHGIERHTNPFVSYGVTQFGFAGSCILHEAENMNS